MRGQEQYGTECCRFMAAVSGKGWGEAGRSEFLYEMRIFVPVFVINPFFLSVEVELIHAKDDRDVFGQPELPVGVTVFHTYGLHHVSASRVVHVVRRRNIRETISPKPVDDGLAGFRTQAPVPECFSESVPQVVAAGAAYVDITDGYIAAFHADGIV